jgi:hypothetical protein
MPRRPKRAKQLVGSAYKARDYLCKLNTQPQVMDIEPAMETTTHFRKARDYTLRFTKLVLVLVSVFLRCILYNLLFDLSVSNQFDKCMVATGQQSSSRFYMGR